MFIDWKNLSMEASEQILRTFYDEFGLVFTDGGNAVHGRTITVRRELVENGKYRILVSSNYHDAVAVCNFINRCCNLNLEV